MASWLVHAIQRAALQALGMKPKTKRPKTQPQLDQREMKQLMQGGPEEEAEEGAQQSEADQVKGVGFRRWDPRSREHTFETASWSSSSGNGRWNSLAESLNVKARPTCILKGRSYSVCCCLLYQKEAPRIIRRGKICEKAAQRPDNGFGRGCYGDNGRRGRLKGAATAGGRASYPAASAPAPPFK